MAAALTSGSSGRSRRAASRETQPRRRSAAIRRWAAVKSPWQSMLHLPTPAPVVLSRRPLRPCSGPHLTTGAAGRPASTRTARPMSASDLLGGMGFFPTACPGRQGTCRRWGGWLQAVFSPPGPGHAMWEGGRRAWEATIVPLAVRLAAGGSAALAEAPARLTPPGVPLQPRVRLGLLLASVPHSAFPAMDHPIVVADRAFPDDC